ncbi:hypothetical protein [Legionella fallonii]|uniref:Uncharacterized protein n=1 Tax=Legionella fallonii LLAP-10 TaxID=1212491 RepID=A0A098G124_9GAMM|nr:hypothetical protein [Legionella fallonii]CEG55686.1 conserved protein of unknown function [Legionella fallonii LLAP-10]
MGGYGSGQNQHYRSKSTTNGYRCIDIRRWNREKLLQGKNSFNRLWLYDGKVTFSIQVEVVSNLDSLILRWQNANQEEEPQCIKYVVGLTWLDCHFGGQRPWFICPLKTCGRRVAILYGGPVFMCRHCLKLVYQSQRETIIDRAFRGARKIHKKFNWTDSLLDCLEDKPKGMHWRTFIKLCEKYEAYQRILLAEEQRIIHLK